MYTKKMYNVYWYTKKYYSVYPKIASSNNFKQRPTINRIKKTIAKKVCS